MPSVSAVPWGDVPLVWPVVGPLIARAPFGSADRIGAALRDGRMMLWVVHEGPEIIAAVVLQVLADPRRLEVVLVAGRGFADWVGEVQRLIRDYADLVGAKAVTATCRPGMARWLSARGWKRRAVVMELGDGEG